MTALTVRLPEDKHRRLRALAEARGSSLSRLFDEMATALLDESQASERFDALSKAGQGRAARGVELLAKAAGRGTTR
jgi:predicted transcriptional regulator